MPDSGLRSGRHAGAGRGYRPVVEAADVGDAVAANGEDLPAPGRSARLAGSRRAGDVQPRQKCSGAGGHLSDHRPCTGGSGAGPPGDDLVAVGAVGVAGPLRRTLAGTGIEQIPDAIKVAGLQRGPDSSGERGRLCRGVGIVWHDGLPCVRSWPLQRRRGRHPSGIASASQPDAARASSATIDRNAA